MARGVAITYGDVAPEAKENFEPTVSERKFDTLGNLQKYGIQLYNYANPCELYQTVLDGSAKVFPADSAAANIGLWSEQLSQNDGTFAKPITLTLESKGQYSSQGFTFTFDKFNDIFPTRLTIQWLRVTSEGIEDLSGGAVEFTPTSGFYFCRNKVENFNKIIIKFYAVNMPKNRVKIEAIDYGYGTIWNGNELRNVKLSQSIDPISSEIKINTCDFTLDSKTDIEYSFQSKQPLTVSYNGKLLATTFIKSTRRNARFLWDINSEDYISLMDNISFVGGMYSNTPSSAIMTEIFTAAKIPYSIAPCFDSVLLSGYIPYTTCREALMQVCFAALAVVNTANTDVVEVKKLENDIKQTIPLERIMQGQNFESGDTVTGVELTVHDYRAISEALEVYNADDSGSGETILVKFSEPLHDLSITNGTILSSGVNYAYINARTGCTLTGKKYEHRQQLKRKSNTVVLASEKENISLITSATLVSSSNADIVLENCYNWLTRVDATNLRIVIGKDIKTETRTVIYGEKKYGTFKWGEKIVNKVITEQKDVNLGDVIEAETEYLGTISGRNIQQTFNLNGNIIVKEAVLK